MAFHRKVRLSELILCPRMFQNYKSCIQTKMGNWEEWFSGFVAIASTMSLVDAEEMDAERFCSDLAPGAGCYFDWAYVFIGPEVHDMIIPFSCI